MYYIYPGAWLVDAKRSCFLLFSRVGSFFFLCFWVFSFFRSFTITVASGATQAAVRQISFLIDGVDDKIVIPVNGLFGV